MRLSSVQVISVAVLIYNASSSEQVSVCPGGQLNLTCLAAPGETLLEWSLTIPGRSQPEIRFISSMGASKNNASAFAVGQTMFRFIRTSASPALRSLMIINNVISELNGLRVNCSYSNIMVSTTIINVFENAIPKPTIITNEVENFTNEAVNILLEWTVQEEIRGLMYNVSVFPQATLQYHGIKTVRLILFYNILYNVSIAAFCGENSSHTLLELLYVKCIDPLDLLTEANRQLVITDYYSPAYEGTNVTFSCNDPQLLLVGPESATCTENGIWEPDPRNVGCIQKDVVTLKSYDNATIADNFTECPGDSSTADQSSGIIAAVVSSIIVAVAFFILGCTSGWFGHKYKDNIIQSKSGKNTNTQPAPLYEDLQPTSTAQDQEKAFELKENVAYGPVRAT